MQKKPLTGFTGNSSTLHYIHLNLETPWYLGSECYTAFPAAPLLGQMSRLLQGSLRRGARGRAVLSPADFLPYSLGNWQLLFGRMKIYLKNLNNKPGPSNKSLSFFSNTHNPLFLRLSLLKTDPQVFQTTPSTGPKSIHPFLFSTVHHPCWISGYQYFLQAVRPLMTTWKTEDVLMLLRTLMRGIATLKIMVRSKLSSLFLIPTPPPTVWFESLESNVSSFISVRTPSGYNMSGPT